MRIHRIVAGLIALVMLALLPAVAGSSAVAADGEATATKVAAPAAAQALAPKPARKVTIRGKEPRTNRFFVLGKVGGPVKYPNKPITVQRKLASQTKWKPYKRVKTNARSSYRVRVAALKRTGKVEYRTLTPRTKNYRATPSNGKIVITTTRF